MKKKSSITFDEFLEKDPKFKKKFNKEFEKYQNRPKPNKKLKIGLKYIKKHFNLDLFLKKIEKYNYRYMNEGNMLDRVIGYGFEQKEVYKIRDHFDDKEFETLTKLAVVYKLLPKITDNFEEIDFKETETLEKWIGATLLSSKKNSTYYLFIDEIIKDEGKKGNCLYFKSKNKKLVWNKMVKIIQEIDKENNSSKSTNIN
jgi:hypothetical protein